MAAGLLAGFTVIDGEVQPRAARSYTASSTVLLTSPNPEYLQTEIPGEVQALPQPSAGQPQEVMVRESTPLRLSDSAIILAYLASSDVVIDAAATAVDGFHDGDAVTAVQRTTQPAGNEQFAGRLQLPIIDIVGVSTSAERAELLAAEATDAFTDLVAAEQAAWGVDPEIRLVLDELNVPVADTGEGSNPAVPVIVVGAGVFLLFVALALIIEAVREKRRARGDGADDDGVVDERDAELAALTEAARRASVTSDTARR